MRLGSLEPSKAVGTILRLAEEAIAVKGITRRADALDCVRQIIKNWQIHHKEGQWRK